MTSPPPPPSNPLGLFIQPACLQHKYIRHSNSSHIFERPERLRAVLLGVAAAIARLEEAEAAAATGDASPSLAGATSAGDDLSSLLSSLSIGKTFSLTRHLTVVPCPPLPATPGSILLHNPAVQLAHSPVPEAPFPYIGPGSTGGRGASFPSSEYLKDLVKWANEAPEKIKETGCEIPQGMGLNAGDLYLGPGSIVAIEGAIQTVCQAIDCVVKRQTPLATPSKTEPTTPPGQTVSSSSELHTPVITEPEAQHEAFTKAFCAIRPPGHHCGEDEPSGFCYVNNVVVGAMHAYLQHDIDRAIIIDFDLHHGNGTQSLVMPLNAAAYANDLQVKAGKPAPIGKDGRKRRGWKGFYGSVHDIYSYPCEDGDLDLIKDASVSLAAHGQYIENIHLKPYADEADFYARIYPLYIALLDKAKVYMEQTEAAPGRTIVFISAGFDACEHEHQGMQRHDRRVPVSFYSRYTKDIGAFADKYTEGKVVSVLEGGYSDRALMSAAMGHIVGMKGHLPIGCDEWWTEFELINIEKATKKKRTGKLQPFPPELSPHPHLARTHALLGHFEGQPAESSAPSVASTPQQGARMTLRGRKKPEDSAPASTETTPVGRKPRGRGGAVAAGETPTHVASKLKAQVLAGVQSQPALVASTPVASGKPLEVNTTPKVKSRSPKAPNVLPKVETGVEPKPEPVENDLLDEAVKGMEAVSLNAGSEVAGASASTEGKAQQQPASPSASAPLPKIFLRIPARQRSSDSVPTVPIVQPPAPQTQPSEREQLPHILPPFPIQLPPQTFSHQPPQQQTTLYPALPGTPSQPPALSQDQSELSVEQRMAYREASVSTEGGDTEYASAQSGAEDVRGGREGTEESGSTFDMPGGFGQ